MPSPAQHTRDAFQGPIDTLRHRLAPELELPSLGRRAVVRESQEVERLRPSLPALLVIGRCNSAELHEPRLSRVYFKVGAPETALLTCGAEGLLEGVWRQGGGVETGRQQGFDLGE